MKDSPYNNEQEFNRLMLQVDDELSKEGLTIPQRPIHALRVISTKFNLPIPLTPPIAGANHESFNYWYISEEVYDWYDNRYGDRQKINFSLGRMVFMIHNDLWIFVFPRIFGSVQLTASTESIKSDEIRIDGQPHVYNIIDCVQGLPDGLRSSLSNDQLSNIFNDFILGFNVLSGMEGLANEELINSALSDISAAVDHLFNQNPNYGLSKWSSLQATEKMIKQIIKNANGKYSKKHDLKLLAEEVKEHGLTLNIHNEIRLIQCSPDIRYGQEACSRDEALLAHHSFFNITIECLKCLKIDPMICIREY